MIGIGKRILCLKGFKVWLGDLSKVLKLGRSGFGSAGSYPKSWVESGLAADQRIGWIGIGISKPDWLDRLWVGWIGPDQDWPI